MSNPVNVTGRVSRRQAIAASAAALSFTYVQRSAWGANDRLNVACIGIGGKGTGDVNDVAAAGGTIVALCDVDENRRKRRNQDPRDRYPDARYFRDFRKMLDEMRDDIDAVTVSTPDHTHCVAAVAAMQLGKHVYCQKPLTRTMAEARLMATTAAEMGVATQMGNQAHAGEPIRRAVEWIRAGLIGKVTEVHAWTNRPIWPQGMARRPAAQTVPDGLDWNLWLGPAPLREYNAAYCPFKWRGWWDFGTGALGDMGCHIMDMPYWALDLTQPTLVEASSEGNTNESGPTEATVTYHFPDTSYCRDLKFHWYDGKRPAPAAVTGGLEVSVDGQRHEMTSAEIYKQFDLVLVGEKGRFFFQRGKTKFHTLPASLLDEFTVPEPSIPRVAGEDAEWLAACRGGPAALSNFSRSGPFTEIVLLGNLAIRLGKPIEWDAKSLSVKNVPEAQGLIQRADRVW